MKTEDALKRIQEAYSASTSWVDSSLRKQVEANLRQFQGKHPSGSKYLSDAYKYRSKLFRPKTRSAIRQLEAATAAAFFSTDTVADVSAVDDNNPAQLASADLMKEILQYRLTKTIPWFLTVVGGVQDAANQGVVISYQYWDYQAKIKKTQQPLEYQGMPILDETGAPVMEEVEEEEVIVDKPCVELCPVENIRIDPSARWYDPIGTSPYIIELIPMYACDVKARMEQVDTKTNLPKWKKLSDEELRAGLKQTQDPTRQTREESREDPFQTSASASPLGHYEVVWIHRNIFKDASGNDFVLHTVGTEYALHEPKPIEEVYLHGERPYAMGFLVLETHKTYPQAVAELGRDLQQEINEIANLRMDNVKLALNRRRYVRKHAVTDYSSLRRLIPGAVTVVSDPERDVKWEETKDVTGSSYQEQDRLNLDFDEVVGTFSQSSLQANRNMNETVGGLNLISAGASQITEYTLRLFSETWVEKVLWQVIALEQAYETDSVVLGLAARQAKLAQKYGIDEVTDDLLQQKLTLNLNVGISSTNPITQIQRFAFGMQTLASMFGPEMLQQILRADQVIPEIFGKIGYRDGGRFFRNTEAGDDPRIAQLTQVVQELQKAIETKQVEEQARDERMTKLKQMDVEGKLLDTQIQGEFDLEQERMRQVKDILNGVQ